ncbi:rhomboid family intramembrane serine protease [Candidatus Pacearchaeota archaeon]|jgi:hypothetical protein|nr:rhomboid family intramembrane serine protease [Candidatus Pacearchaeota archaeon]
MTFYQIPNRKKLFNFNATLLIILINIFCFFVFSALIYFNPSFVDYIALKSSNIINNFYLWTFLTSMFMHSGFFHLFANMISLFFVGSLVEKIIGKKRYVWFYLISGIFAGLFFALSSYFFGGSELGARIFGSPESFAVGASGAIFGLLGLLAVLIPHKNIYLIAGPLIAIALQSVAGIFFSGNILGFIDTFVTIYIFIAIFSMLSFNNHIRRISIPLELQFWILPFFAIVPLILISFFIELPIGNMAHLGGLIAGLIYGFYLRKKYENKTKYISKYFS